jgi:hypothetical protein
MPDASEIKRQVEDICHSTVLDGAPLRRDLFRYIVKATLAGEPATETSIAIKVYGKTPDTFHPAIDAIVRVETGKLRKRLKKFYENEGKNAPLRITIEKYAAVAQYTDNYVPSQSSNASPTVLELQRPQIETLLYSSELRLPNTFLSHLIFDPCIRVPQGPQSTIPAQVFLTPDEPGAIRIYDGDVVRHIVSFQQAAENGELDDEKWGLYDPDFDAKAKGAEHVHVYHDVDTSFFGMTSELKAVLALESAQLLFLRQEARRRAPYPFIRLMTEKRWTAMQRE